METTELKKQDVIDQLVWDDRVNANDVMVQVENSTVKLKGEVPSFRGRIAAEEDAYMVDGVVHVENELEVKFPDLTILPNDAEITSNISNMLLWNDSIISSDIRIETNNRVVTLSGSVGTYWEKHEAEEVASSAYGVAGVINLLEVNLTKSWVDIDIQTDIENAFRRNTLINENKIDVTVVDGVVTLSGSVINYPVKRLALDIARYTAGVIDVIDALTVEYS